MWDALKQRAHPLLLVTEVLVSPGTGELGLKMEQKMKNSLTGGFEPPTFRLTAERSAD